MATDEQEDYLHHLSALKAVEVSFVPAGAVGRNFLVLKNAEESDVNLEQILKTVALKNEAKIDKILKDAGLGDNVAALKAALRVLTSMGDKVPPQLLQQLQALAQEEAQETGENADPGADPAAVAADPAAGAAGAAGTEGDKGGAAAVHAAAAQAHTAAADAHNKAAAAAGGGTPPAPAPTEKQAPGNGAPPPKNKEAIMKADEVILKADGSLDETKLEGVPEPIRKTLTALWTSNKAANDNVTAIKKQLDDERDARITKEYVAKAASLKNLPGDKEALGKVLKEVAIKAPKEYEAIEAVLKQADAMIGKSGILKEAGSSAGGGSRGSSTDSSTGTGPATADQDYAKIEQAAVAIHKEAIAKGDMTKEGATTAFISKSAEGRRMYAEYVAGQNNK